MPSKIQIDGSYGEGGGQVLRTALSLAMITGNSVELINIRAGRRKPGLMRQHLVCVQASQRICNATVVGAELNSQRLHFVPKPVRSGRYHFDIGTAGSTTLVLQTLLPALLLQDQPSELTISGGTHNPLAPTAEEIERCFLPCLRRIGIDVEFRLEQAGFYPVGGGKIYAKIHPWQQKSRLCLVDRGRLQSINASAAYINSPVEAQAAQSALATLSKLLDLDSSQITELSGVSRGGIICAEVRLQNHNELFIASIERKLPPEKIAHQLADQVRLYLESNALVDEYLADQLLLPLVLGQGGEFTTQCISEHTLTQAFMIRKFTGSSVEFTQRGPLEFHVLVTKA